MARVHPANLLTGAASAANTDRTAIIAAQGAGVRVHLTDVTVSNTSATAEDVLIEDGTTTKYRFEVPANGTIPHTFKTPLRGTANTAWNFSAVTGATTIYVSANGFIGE